MPTLIFAKLHIFTIDTCRHFHDCEISIQLTVTCEPLIVQGNVYLS